jgi:hypothetical protein
MGAILGVWDQDLRRWLAMQVALGRDGDGNSGAARDRPEPLETSASGIGRRLSGAGAGRGGCPRSAARPRVG